MLIASIAPLTRARDEVADPDVAEPAAARAAALVPALATVALIAYLL
jgi:hypothetical protein